MSRRDEVASSVSEAFYDMKADYNAAKVSPYRRLRQGTLAVGSHADWHIRVPTDYWRIMEQARTFDRDDMLVSQMVNRAVSNTLQGGFRPQPDTGDPGLDTELTERWHDWAGDEEKVDLEGEKTFHEMERLGLRQHFVDGDVFALLLREGGMQMIEAHRARTPGNANRKDAAKRHMVHGVLLDDNRRRLEVWFTNEQIDIWASIERISDMDKRKVRDDQGFRQLCQIYSPSRSTQTRGISALAPVFDPVGMHEDIQFAAMVQRQVATCFAVLRERELGFKGNDGPPLGDVPCVPHSGPALRRLSGGIAPGMEITGEPGEKITGYAPNIPGGDYFEHMRSIIQLIGVNLGLPLVLALLDASETNFSGWRGAVDQARLGFKDNQRMLIRRFHRPVWKWRVRQWMADDPAINAKAKSGIVDPLAHRWNTPAWPYIDPYKDAQSDVYELANLLTSPRRKYAERDCQGIEEETVDDRARSIVYAKKKAVEVNKAVDDNTPITWRDLLPLPYPAGFKVAAAENLPGGDDDESAAPKKTNPTRGKPQAKRA